METTMTRRETILRDEIDGKKRPHEVEIRRYRARSGDRVMTIDADSWFNARTLARISFQTEAVEVEEIDMLDGVVADRVA
jgi:hypothetical protein